MPCPGCNCFGILFVEECFLSADSPVAPSPSPPHACAALLVPLSAPDGLPRLLLISALSGKKTFRPTVNRHGSLSLRVWLPFFFILFLKHRSHSTLTHGVFLLTCELPGGVFPPSYEPRHGGSALLVTFYCFVIHFPEEVLLPSGTGGCLPRHRMVLSPLGGPLHG